MVFAPKGLTSFYPAPPPPPQPLLLNTHSSPTFHHFPLPLPLPTPKAESGSNSGPKLCSTQANESHECLDESLLAILPPREVQSHCKHRLSTTAYPLFHNHPKNQATNGLQRGIILDEGFTLRGRWALCKFPLLLLLFIHTEIWGNKWKFIYGI